MRHVLPATALVATLLFAPSTRTEHWDVFAPIGGTFGYGFNPKKLDNSSVLGGEASVAFLQGDRFYWFGGYADAVYDAGAHASRFSLGPELGWAFIGIDGGVVLSTLNNVHAGVCGRFLLTTGIVSAYARVGSIFHSAPEGTYGELGMLLKLPIPVDLGRGPPPPRPPLEPPMPQAVPPEQEQPAPPSPVPDPPPPTPDLPVAI